MTTFATQDYASGAQKDVRVTASPYGNATLNRILASPVDGEALLRDASLHISRGRMRTVLPAQPVRYLPSGWFDPRRWRLTTRKPDQYGVVGTVVHDSAQSCLVLSPSDQIAFSYAEVYTSSFTRYRLGRSVMVLMAFTMSWPRLIGDVLIGPHDDDFGAFFQTEVDADGNATYSFVIRNAFGTDTPYERSVWNIDKLDGSGTSGKTLDFTTQQIFFIEFLWPHTTRFGFVVDGKYLTAHVVTDANTGTAALVQSTDRSLRTKIVNNGAKPAVASMRLYWAAVFSDEAPEASMPTSHDYGMPATVAVTVAHTYLMSLKAVAPARVRPISWEPYCKTADALFEAWLVVPTDANPTDLTGTSYSNPSGSTAYRDITGSISTFGPPRRIDACYQGASKRGDPRPFMIDFDLWSEVGAASDPFLMFTASPIGGVATDCAVSVAWEDFL